MVWQLEEKDMTTHRLLGEAGASPAHRIVSLAPSITDTLVALNLSERVVGITESCGLATTKERLAPSRGLT